MRGEVHRGGHLVHGPFGLDVRAVGLGVNEVRMLHHMGELEHHGDEDPGHEHHHTIAHKGGNDASEEHGQHEEHRHIGDLGHPEDDVLLHAHRFHLRVVRDLACEVFLQVVVEYPEEVSEPIEQEAVDVLEAVEPMFWLALVHAHPGLDVDVVIHTLHVGERVVVDVVLELPEIDATAEQVEGVPHHLVHPLVAAVAAMGAIVHHVEPHAGQHHAQEGAQGQ